MLAYDFVRRVRFHFHVAIWREVTSNNLICLKHGLYHPIESECIHHEPRIFEVPNSICLHGEYLSFARGRGRHARLDCSGRLGEPY